MPKIKQREPWHGPDSPPESKLFVLVLALGTIMVAVIFAQGLRDSTSPDFHLTHG